MMEFDERIQEQSALSEKTTLQKDTMQGGDQLREHLM